MKKTACASLAMSLLVSAAVSAEGDFCRPSPQAMPPETYRSTLFDRSTFTHSPETRQRVAQYAELAPAYRVGGYYERSAYRHNQSVIARGRSADRLHVVETIGRGAEIRPYGEWLRPYRRGARPIWETDPQAYFYGSYPYPYLFENRDYVTFDRAGRSDRHAKPDASPSYDRERRDVGRGRKKTHQGRSIRSGHPRDTRRSY